MRNIVLREDRPAVAHPECHARGLAPYCRENPALRIERRLSLWENLFLTSISPGSDLLELFMNGFAQPNLPADSITRGVAMWMAEAALPEIPDAITLVLEGGPIPERTAQVFREVVQRDAAWQTALDRTFRLEAGTSDHDDVFHKRGVQAFHFAGFPELLRDAVMVGAGEGSSIRPAERRRGAGDAAAAGRICCTFDPGHAWDDAMVAEIARTNGGHAAGLDAWAEAWTRTREGYQTMPPLPEYNLLFDSLVTNADELRADPSMQQFRIIAAL